MDVVAFDTPEERTFRAASRAVRDDLYRVQTLLAKSIEAGGWPANGLAMPQPFSPMSTVEDYHALASFLPGRGIDENSNMAIWTRVTRARAKMLDDVLSNYRAGIWLGTEWAIDAFEVCEAGRFGAYHPDYDDWAPEVHRLTDLVPDMA